MLIDELKTELTGDVDERVDGGRGTLDEDFTEADIKRQQTYRRRTIFFRMWKYLVFTLARATVRHRPRDKALS